MQFRNYIFLILSYFLFFTLKSTFAQGCNDAGFCSIGDMKSGQVSDSGKAEAGFSSGFRLGEKETMLLTIQAEAKFLLWKGGKLATGIPLQLIYGDRGFVSGIGDIAPSFTQQLAVNDSNKFTLTLAGKIPTGRADKSINKEPLPMAYQVSQGTWDGIAGINWFYKKWHLSLAYQHNFHANGNLYVDSLRPDSTSPSYFDSRKIDRGDDILLRIEHIFKKNGKPKYLLSVLPIYRLQEATIENDKGERVSVKGSSGLTININAGILFYSKSGRNMKLLAGFPTITRHVRPDGLTGTFVISFSSSWNL